MRLDAHQHFWIYDPEQYPWIMPHSPLERDWLPDDWLAAATPSGLTGSIAVQARQTLEESRWLLDLADKYAFIKGVVGWVDLCSLNLPAQLSEFSRQSKFVGVRHVVQDEMDDQFMLRSYFQRGIEMLKDYDVCYDILIYPRQLSAAIELARKFPEQPFVLDHIAKPGIRDHEISPWREQMQLLAKSSNVHCKVSGMVTEASLRGWKKDDFRPYLDVVVEAFGEDRIMFGSDWPVCLLSADYSEVFTIAAEYMKQFPEPVMNKFFGDNAAKFYGIPLENAIR